ncbi:MAG: hypothetical protein ACYTHJ_20025 [Planctomycetota bacterium]|jgi:hypothetical protein
MKLTGLFALAASVVAASANAAQIDIVPIRSSGGGTVTGNEITVQPGEMVEVEVRISGFADSAVAAYQGAIDCATLDASGGGELVPIPTDCTVGGGVFGVDYCLGVNEEEPTYLLANAAATLPACQNISACPDGDPGAYACGAVSIVGDSGPDNGGQYYGVTYGFTVSNDMRGTASFNVLADPNQTFLKDPMARDIPIDVSNPALITVPVGACCGDGGNLNCQDGLLEAECGGAWLQGVTCTGTPGAGGDDEACPVCPGTPEEDAIFCDDDNDCTDDTCDIQLGCVNTDTTPEGQCCAPDGGGFTMIDDGDDCTDDICNEDGSVDHLPSAAGTTCDDGNGCTTADECDGAGTCAGTDINSLTCGTIDDCPAGSQSCENGFCVCTLETKMELVVQDSDLPDGDCFGEGDAVNVDVVMGAGSECVTGGQFLVVYDPTCLSYEGISASDFFPVIIFTDIDDDAGTVFAAIGVMPGGDCTQGPETLATLSFSKLGDCGECSVSYDNQNPQNTILTNNEGNSVPLTFNDSEAIRLAGDIELDTPSGDIIVNADCDAPVATVTWDAISATDSCEGESSIECTVTTSSGLDLTDLAESGGVFPQGDHEFVCVASNSCGASVTSDWRVHVSDEHAMNVEVQLSPAIVGDPLGRCICFDFYSDCVQAPTTWCEELNFGFPYDFTGKASAELKVPKGQYACITAKDPLHSLRSVSDIDCVGNALVAEFKGDPVFDGNWLTGGNLDCWKADGNGDTIDILDFGMFVYQYLDSLEPSTDCQSEGPHADINGDGIVDAGDFVFLSQNFLKTSKNSCCEDATAAAGEEPVVAITVKELRRRGLGELVVADLNGDFMIDQTDMAVFMAGQPTERNIKRANSLGGRNGNLGR